MTNLFLLTLISLSTLVSVDSECALSPDVLAAHYSRSVSFSDGSPDRSSALSLWRYQRRIAHQYTQLGRTDEWARVTENRVQLTRYFDADRRGIEYEPEFVAASSIQAAWEARSQLVTSEQIRQLQLMGTEGDGCDRVETYAGKLGEADVRLKWLPHQALLAAWSQASESRTIEVKLLSIEHDANEVSAQFERRDSYLLTDWADIGDNETDPFFAKMINLGFVERHNGSENNHAH